MARTEPFVAAPDSDADLLYRGVGTELRAAREAAGHSVDLIASTLRIRRPNIQAIEEGRFQDLPGQVYAIGFVRAYAEYLQLDGDLMVERFRDEADGPSAKLELHFPEPAARRTRLDPRALGVGVLIAAAAYGTWYYLQTREQFPRELVAVVPPDLLVAADDQTVAEPAAEELVEAPVASDADAAITAVENQQSLNAEDGADGDAVRFGMTPPNREEAPSTPEDGMLGPFANPALAVLPPPAEPVSETDDAGSTRIAAVPPEFNRSRDWPVAQTPPVEATQPLRDAGVEVGTDGGAPVGGAVAEEGPVPSEEALGAVMVAELEAEGNTLADLETDSEVPLVSDIIGMSQPSEPVDGELGGATPITGAVAGLPEAPTLIENEIPAVPMAIATDYEPRVYGEGNTDARIVVRARIESWVQVQAADNELLLTRVLKPGDMFLVPNRGDLNLVTGNAGGIEILVDGVLMPPLGPEGTVRRIVRLTPDALTGSDTVSSR